MIPPGRVATYGDIARMAGFPGAARLVGRALRGLPAETGIPWHRVINAKGEIALPRASSSWHIQRERLETEGVVFKVNNRVDMRIFRWQPGAEQ